MNSQLRWFLKTMPLLGLVALGATLMASSDKQAISAPVYYDGQTVRMEATSAVLPPGPYNPIYAVVDAVPPTKEFQNEVISKLPGEVGFTPRWEVFAVIVLDPNLDVTKTPFTSDVQILAARAAGKVQVIDAQFSFICAINKAQP